METSSSSISVEYSEMKRRLAHAICTKMQIVCFQKLMLSSFLSSE